MEIGRICIAITILPSPLTWGVDLVTLMHWFVKQMVILEFLFGPCIYSSRIHLGRALCMDIFH